METKIIKKKKVIYIGVTIPEDKIMALPFDKSYFENKTLNKEFHTTLAFAPKEEQLNYYEEFRGKNMNISIVGCGYTGHAVCLLVDSVKTISDGSSESQELKHFQSPKPLHITVALDSQTKPVNSYLAINENLIYWSEPVTLIGTLKYY